MVESKMWSLLCTVGNFARGGLSVDGLDPRLALNTARPSTDPRLARHGPEQTVSAQQGSAHPLFWFVELLWFCSVYPVMCVRDQLRNPVTCGPKGNGGIALHNLVWFLSKPNIPREVSRRSVVIP